MDFLNEKKRAPSDTFMRMYEHVNRFAQFRTGDAARESRAVLKHLAIPEIVQVELADLVPKTPEEARAYVGRALDGVGDEELSRVLEELNQCQRGIKTE
jgi:DNA-directed RNA polymerase subunit F